MCVFSLTNGCDGYIIGIKTKEGRGSAHYELIWEIPVNIAQNNKGGAEMKMKIVWLVVSCLMVAALVLASCTSTPKSQYPVASKTPKYGGEIILVLDRPSVGFDDVVATPFRVYALNFACDQLLIGDWTKGPGGTNKASFAFNDFALSYMTGNLVESWEITDADTLIFHIKKGVHFTLNPDLEASVMVGGREFTADDAAFNFTRAFTSKGAYMNTNFPGWFESATAPDKYTLVIKGHDSELNRTSTIIANITQTVRFMAPEVIEKYGDTTDWRNVVGTGPY
ncbi:MAG: ABC transporter substrate-binding protein, partial [Chloroflexota bacterium]